MATFYKYKDRDDITKSMIDWSGITKDISDNLMKEKDRRDTLKAKIEEDQLEKLKAVDAYAKGLDPTMNQSMLKVAQNYKDYLLNSHKLMKQGLVSVADTKIQKQGAMDTFNGINDAVKGYNEKIGAFVEAGGTLNEYLASNIARALDISKSQLVIDKMGRGSFVTMDEDGNEIIVPATSLGTILNKKFNRFDTTGEVVNVVKGLGDWVRTSAKGYKSLSDLRQRKEYSTILNAKVDEILNSEDRVVEAASDMMKMEITDDRKLYESQPDKYILSEMKGGKIKLSANREAVSKRLYDHIDAAISSTEKETPRPVIRPNAYDIKNKNEKQLYNLITGALKGNESDLQSLSNSFNFRNIQPQDNGDIKITLKNGDTKTIKTSKGIKDGGATFAAALGLNAAEYKNTVGSDSLVDPKFLQNIGTVSYVKENIVNESNIKKLYNSIRFKDMGGDTVLMTGNEKITAFKNALDGILIGQNVDYSIDSVTGDVTINGIVIKEGINKPNEVLEAAGGTENNNPELEAAGGTANNKPNLNASSRKN